jgi:hypothetical protein
VVVTVSVPPQTLKLSQTEAVLTAHFNYPASDQSNRMDFSITPKLSEGWTQVDIAVQRTNRTSNFDVLLDRVRRQQR